MSNTMESPVTKVGSLTLTRKPGEGITVTVPASETDTVIHVEHALNSPRKAQAKLAFQAPVDVVIVRDELIHEAEGAA